jgi:von Willebrand factor A domain-containing protein 8
VLFFYLIGFDIAFYTNFNNVLNQIKMQYRLDRGHEVHQVSDEAKAQVSDEAKAAALRIAKKAFAEKLEEIGMSESEHEHYSAFLEPINADIASLRTALHAVEYRALQRDWIKNQMDGELDDSKFIEGIAGEKHVYKRRGMIDTLSGHHMPRPKRLRFVVDCSGSMYRFNSYDERLNRCLQATALVMESFENMQDKFDYSIVGHSGESHCIDLVPFGEPPVNAKERMRVLQTMIAHSQFCESGDNTLAAVKQAMSDVVPRGSDADDFTGNAIVVAISDANLERYGITPKDLSRSMQSRSDASSLTAKAYCIFIASFGDEAESIKRELPVGRSFVCMESSELPHIVRNILLSEIG